MESSIAIEQAKELFSRLAKKSENTKEVLNVEYEDENNKKNKELEIMLLKSLDNFVTTFQKRYKNPV